MVRGSESPVTIRTWLAPGHLRVDTGEQTSVIVIGGDEPRALMVDHAGRRYIEWGAEHMRMMEGMARGMGPPGRAAGDEGAAEEERIAGAPARFVRTGNTKKVGPWTAYEVRVEAPGVGGELALWFSEDLDIGWAEFLEEQDSVMRSLPTAMQDLGLASFGGLWGSLRGSGGAEHPAGFPVQLAGVYQGAAISMTLGEFRRESFPQSVFEAPAGYRKMELPVIRSRPPDG